MTRVIEYLEPHELIEDKYKRIGIEIHELVECFHNGKCSERLLEIYDEAYYDLIEYEKTLKQSK